MDRERPRAADPDLDRLVHNRVRLGGLLGHGGDDGLEDLWSAARRDGIWPGVRSRHDPTTAWPRS